MTSTSQIPEATFSLKEVVDQTGVSQYLLRVWEQRYNWPSPKRRRNGYRAYMQSDIDDIKRVFALVQSGKKIGSLIANGRPIDAPQDNVP